jgi:KaiC/GvpD/RAD55 family RecA-like ATPase
MFDSLIDQRGIERGSTIILSGGCGVGKTIFALQSIYNGALNGEKSVYLTLTEDPEKIKKHAKVSFGWDIDSMEKQDLVRIMKIDPYEVASDINAIMSTSEDRWVINLDSSSETISLFDSKKLKLPFKPDRIVIDSLSALSSSFSDKNNYRLYIQVLMDALNKHNSVNYLINEMIQDPTTCFNTGIEEFLADGVFILYSIRKGQLMRNAIEIVKLRCSGHVREMVPYMITNEGIKLHLGEKIM